MNYKNERMQEILEGWNDEAGYTITEIKQLLEQSWEGEAREGFLGKIEEFQMHMMETVTLLEKQL